MSKNRTIANIATTVAEKANASSLANVATSGSYTDLTNKPTIPSDVGDLTDTGDILSSGGSASFEKSYRYAGTLETNVSTLRLYLHKAATLSEINLFVQTAPTGSSINLDINKNGISVATPSIAAGQTSNTDISANVSFAVGDYITVDIDQVGSGTAGSDLYAVLTFS